MKATHPLFKRLCSS